MEFVMMINKSNFLTMTYQKRIWSSSPFLSFSSTLFKPLGILFLGIVKSTVQVWLLQISSLLCASVQPLYFRLKPTLEQGLEVPIITLYYCCVKLVRVQYSITLIEISILHNYLIICEIPLSEYSV